MDSAQVQPIVFTGSLNTDLDLKSIKTGDYIAASCFRNIFTENGIDGSGENISSNANVAYTLPSGTNKVIGVYEDEVNFTTFYFIWNSGADNLILRYYPQNTGAVAKIQIILQKNALRYPDLGTLLNFSEWGYITSINLVGDLFYWTQGDNPQRFINITKSNDYQKLPIFKLCFDTTGTISVVRYEFSNLNGGGLGFFVDVTLAGGSRSANTLQAYTALNANANFTTNFDSVNEGEYLLVTDKILPATYSNTTLTVSQISGTIGSWFIAENYYPTITLKTLDPVVWPMWLEPACELADVSGVDTNFLNGKAYQFRVRIYGSDSRISVLSKVSQMIYYLADTATVSDFLDYTQYTPYNAVEIDYSDSGRIFAQRELVKAVEILVRNTNTETFRSVAMLSDFELEGLFTFFNSVIGTAVSQNDDSKQFDAIPVYSVGQEVVNNKLFYAHNTVGYDTVPILAAVTCTSQFLAWDTITNMRPKFFGKYKFGLVYFDRFGRNAFVSQNDSLEINVPNPNRQIASSATPKPTVEWNIYSQPPDWATHYAWVRTKDLNHQFYTYLKISDVTSYLNNINAPAAWGGGDVYKAEILLNSSTVYTFTQGDYLRIVKYNTAAPKLYADSWVVEIESYDEETYVLIVKYNAQANTTLVNLDAILSQLQLQAFTPHKEVASELYYEFSECYEVGDAGLSTRYHKGGYEGADQVPDVTPASGYFYNGWDTFHVNATPYTEIDAAGFSTEAQSANVEVTRTVTKKVLEVNEDGNFWDNGVLRNGVSLVFKTQAGTLLPGEPSVTFKSGTLTVDDVTTEITYDRNLITGIGRPNAVFPNNRQNVIKEDIQFSNPYNIGTGYNGFGSFEALNHNVVPSGYGGVSRLINVENVLLAVCVKKTFSIYVDKGIIQTNPGEQLISNVTQVLGALRYLDGSHGTINPESFARTGGLAFWWDAYNGEVCQYSTNGIDIVSKYGRKNFFAGKGAVGIRATPLTYKVLGAIHGQFKEYLMAFNEITVDSVVYPAETVGYSYLKNGWTCNYPYIPEMMSSLGINILTFKLGQLYIHKTNASKNTFYGTAYPTTVTSVVNALPSTSKSFLSLSVESSVVPNIPTIQTPITDWNLAGQTSELLEGDFEFMNGSYFASFLMNKLTPNAVSQALALIDGESLQSSVLVVAFSKTTNVLYILKSAECYYIVDALTN